MSDLLTRSTTMKFDIDALQRADVKTRYEVYASGITSGVLTAEEARIAEGLDAGNMENAPVPLSQPQAIPASLPIERSAAVRCPSGHLLAELATPPYRFTCPKCKKVATADAGIVTRSDDTLHELATAFGILATREAPAPVINNYTTVEPPPPAEVNVTIAEGAIHADPAVINVSTPIEAGAIQVNMPAPEPPAPEQRMEYDEAGRLVGVRNLHVVAEEETA